MAEPSPALLETTPEEGSRRLALEWIDQACAACERMRHPRDEEALHDLRVALRKLRTVLRTYKKALRGGIPRKRRDRLKELARTTGDARDAEVQLAWLAEVRGALDEDAQPGVEWLRERLVERKDGAYERLRSESVPALAALLPKLRRDLERYEIEHRVNEAAREPRFASLTAELIEEQADDLAQALRRVKSVDDEELAHEARIHGKRLRYLLEPLRDQLEGAREVAKTLKGLQDLLGEANDVAVRTRSLRDEVESAAGDRARRLALEAERDDARHPARDDIDEQPGLLALVRHTHQRRQELYESLASDWIDGPALEPLLASVAALAAALRPGRVGGGRGAHGDDALPREIERKFLLSALPARARDVEPIEIDQGYLPGQKLHERLRRMRHADTERWYRCVKLGKGISRIEIEEETTRELYAKLWALTKGKRVRKRRYEIEEGGHVFQICLLYTSPSPRDGLLSRMPSSA